MANQISRLLRIPSHSEMFFFPRDDGRHDLRLSVETIKQVRQTHPGFSDFRNHLLKKSTCISKINSGVFNPDSRVLSLISPTRLNVLAIRSEGS